MRLLLVTPYSPFASSFGAQQRTKLLYEALTEIGTVDVLLLEEKEGYGAEVVTGPPRVIHASWCRPRVDLRPFGEDHRLMRALENALDLSKYDVVCSRFLRPLAKLILPPRTPVIVDLDDMMYAYAAQGTPVGWLTSRAKTLARSVLERRALRRYRAFWFVSERDRIRHPWLDGMTLPNVPLEIMPAVHDPPRSRRILFVGALWYGPNREGVERFVQRSWPGIRAAVPDAVLRLVGGAPVDDRRRWSAVAGVEAPGFVNDLAAEYRNAALCVAPIHSGGGTNIKILEALAHGRACVTTPFCKDAFQPHFDDPSALAVASSDRELADTCVRLLHDEQLCGAFARSGHAVVRVHFTRAVFRQAVIGGISKAADTGSGSRSRDLPQ